MSELDTFYEATGELMVKYTDYQTLQSQLTEANKEKKELQGETKHWKKEARRYAMIACICVLLVNITFNYHLLCR